jgi:signal transduction histidine kinase
VTLALAACGWLCAFAAAWRVLTLMRRLELMACAEHELRGPLAALSLAAARSRPVPAIVVEGQLERASIALADLTEARRGRRAPSHAGRNDLGTLAERAAAAWDVRFEWHAGPAPVDAHPGRVAQALGNLIANAFEHGGGRPVLRGVRRGNAVRIEVEDRGRGLAIAQRAAEDAGGRLQLTSTRAGTVAAVELPVADE